MLKAKSDPIASLRILEPDYEHEGVVAAVRALVETHGLHAVLAAAADAARKNTGLAMLRAIDRLLLDNSGTAAIEFGLILAVLGPVCIAGGRLLGPALLGWSNTLIANIATAHALIASLTGCGQ